MRKMESTWNLVVFNLVMMLTFTAILVSAERPRQSVTDTDEGKLRNALWNSEPHDVYLRPVLRTKDAVNVTIQLSLVGLDELDIQRQVMVSHVWLWQRWVNPYLQWEPSEYGGLETTMMPVKNIWTPDIVPHNSLSDTYSLHHSSMAKVNSSGHVLWLTQSKLETFCHTDLTDFPFDEHECSIELGMWPYDSSKVNISYLGEPEVNLQYGPADSHQTWDITDTSVLIRTQKYHYSEELYQEIIINVRLSRLASYITHVLVAPSVMFVLLVPAVFMLPADSANKFILGSGLLLAQVLLLVMLGDILPSAFRTMPRIGLYYLSVLALISSSLGVSAFVANLWNRSRRRSYGVPGVIRVILLKGLGRMVCVHYDDFLASDSIPEPDTDTVSTNLDSVSNSSMNPLDGAKMIREYNSQVVNKAEWRQLAAIMDRLFCFMFLVVSVLIAVAILIRY